MSKKPRPERKVRRIPAGEFKAKCLALLDEVNETGEILIVTKRGRDVARIESASAGPPPDLQGSILYEGDIISPAADEDEWEVNR